MPPKATEGRVRKPRRPSRSGIGKGRRARVVELYLSGTRPGEIARAMRVSPSVITETLHLPEVRQAIEAANTSARQRITDRRGAHIEEAVEVLVSLMRGEPDESGRPTVSDTVRRQSASDLLDRFGLPKDASLNVSGQVAVGILDLSRMTPEQLRELRALAWGDATEFTVITLPETPEAK